MSDSRDLAHREPDAPVVRQSDNLLAQVIAAAKDPNIDAQKMETLARLVNTQQDREREIEFNKSKNAAIQRMPVITKDGRIIITKDGISREQGRFAKWEDIDRVVRPILASLNLALSFDIAEKQGGGLTVTPILSHANGYTQRGGAFPVPMEKSGSKNDAQAMGSAASYGKRYSGCAMLNIVTEGVDDDGNMGRGTGIKLPFEREQVVLKDAEEAHADGRYVEWFATQSPKDRAWLIQSGKHVEFGGQPMLTSDNARQPRRRESARPTPTPAAREPTPEPEPEPEPVVETGGTGGDQPTKRTPEQMVEDFKKRIDECTDSRTVIDLQAEPRVLVWMEKLERQHPDLHQSITDHAARKYSTLLAAEREAKRRGDNLL